MHVYMPPGTSNEDMVYLIEKALCTGKKYGGVEWESLERTTATEDLKLNEEVRIVTGKQIGRAHV